jgi:hypothetical protein
MYEPPPPLDRDVICEQPPKLKQCEQIVVPKSFPRKFLPLELVILVINSLKKV